jgi:hypothetical protein
MKQWRDRVHLVKILYERGHADKKKRRRSYCVTAVLRARVMSVIRCSDRRKKNYERAQRSVSQDMHESALRNRGQVGQRDGRLRTSAVSVSSDCRRIALDRRRPSLIVVNGRYVLVRDESLSDRYQSPQPFRRRSVAVNRPIRPGTEDSRLSRAFRPR